MFLDFIIFNIHDTMAWCVTIKIFVSFLQFCLIIVRRNSFVLFSTSCIDSLNLYFSGPIIDLYLLSTLTLFAIYKGNFTLYDFSGIIKELIFSLYE